MTDEQTKEECLKVQYEYLEKYRESNPNRNDMEIVIQIFPDGWFLNSNFAKKLELLRKAIKENKNLRDYKECYQLLHPRDF